MFRSKKIFYPVPSPNAVSSHLSLLAPKFNQNSKGRQQPVHNCNASSPQQVLREKVNSLHVIPKNNPPSAIVRSKAQRDEQSEIAARRWMRDPFETCVLKTQRVSNILPHYVAYYKFADYTWRPLLLVPAGDPTGLETRARHVAYELRHLSEFGHAVWFTTKTSHSIIHPKGVIERSYIECTYVKGNRQRLQCYIRHEGPCDAGDPDSKRALIAVSMVHTLSGPEDRWKMLVCRSRRTGAMSAGLGALNLRLIKPGLVGKKQQEEVLLLEPHTEVVGNGLNARCIASCWNLCKHPYLYLNPMEVPAAVGLDSVMQAIHYTALTNNQLIKRDEHMVCLAFSVESFHPFAPIEAELPYTIALSSPVVFPSDDVSWQENECIGTPYVEGGPVQRYSAAITIGYAQFCDQREMVPLERAHKWWAHHDETPYRVTMYTTRDAHFGKFHSTDTVNENPFEKGNAYSCPNSKTIERERLRNAMWRRVEEYGVDPEADIDGDGVRGIGEEREDTKPFLLSTTQDKSPEEIQNHMGLPPNGAALAGQKDATIEGVREKLGISDDLNGKSKRSDE